MNSWSGSHYPPQGDFWSQAGTCLVNHSHLSFLQHRFACLGRSINTLICPGRNLVAVARHRHYYVPNNLAGFKVNVTVRLGLRDPNLLKDAGWHLHELWDRGDAA